MSEEETIQSEAVEELIPSPQSNGAATKKRTKTVVKAGKVVKKKLVKKKKIIRKENPQTKLIKYSALLMLVAQMVGLVLLMRYTRTNRAPDQPLYLASSAVFVMECMKFFLCSCVIAFQSESSLFEELKEHVWNSPMEMVKLCVPSLLYTVQNNLLYLALTNLDASTYQVLYQLKILTTALFSALLLQRKFSAKKWFALIILTIGVAIVQVSGSGDKHNNPATDSRHRLIGLVAVLCAACTSGFAGVYFEKILKGSQTTLWLRNIQMGLPSILIAFITIYSKDSKVVAEQGILGGFSVMVWTVVIVQAAGGLIVAVVVKYADNVLKVFASSFSIIISCIISAIFFDFHATFLFLLGAGLVVGATAIYSAPEGRARTHRKPVLPVSNTSSVSRRSHVM
mmetsp:Transcript_1789/g.2629  ORF Transcript_1789/g.2629 Transcript_1789/m.2629 type:complete len:397 (-) Transcript_1789:70-1260(-)